MRSTLLLASLLAVVPLISATPARRDASITQQVTLKDGTKFIVNGCHALDGTLTDEETPEGGADKLTPKTCLAKCHSMQATQGGVGNNKCYCANGSSGGPPKPEAFCKQWPCPGDKSQYCGSGDSLIFYSP